MSKLKLKRDYKTTLTDTVPAVGTGEVEFKLATNPASGMGFILVEPGVVGKEESAFFHRRVGNSVFVYGTNRSLVTEHLAGSQVRLANTVDYVNYLSENTFDQGYVYRIDANNVGIFGGDFFIGSNQVAIADLDTSAGLPGKVLIPGSTNYVYVRDGDYSIENVYDNSVYLVAVIEMSGSTVVSFTRKYTFPIGTQGEQGVPGERGIQGVPGDDGIAGQIASATAVTVSPETPASVTLGGTPSVRTMQFNIPKGETGDPGLGIVWKGVWPANAPFAVNDAVEHNGSSYVCVTAPGNIEPGTGLGQWNLIAKKGDAGSIATAPAGAPQTVDDNLVPPAGYSVSTDDASHVTITYADGSKAIYNLTGIRTYDKEGELVTESLKTGTWISTGISYPGSTVDKATGIVNVTGSPAYRDVFNTFTDANVFEGDVVFKKRVSFPFHNIGTQGAAINFNGLNGTNQKVTLTGTSTHTLNLSYLTQGVYILFVAQQSTGAISFANPTNSGTVTGMAIMNASFVNWSVANTVGTHIFTILVAETKAHVTYNWTSV